MGVRSVDTGSTGFTLREKIKIENHEILDNHNVGEVTSVFVLIVANSSLYDVIRFSASMCSDVTYFSLFSLPFNF